MPFIRYTRDKRGYETTFVMHSYRPTQGPQRTRVLYLFRAPSHVRMGRRPLDEEAREALEHTHPDLSFDWSALGRESDDVRAHERAHDRDRDRDRDTGRNRRGPQSRAPRPAPREVGPVVEDQTLLGLTLGGAAATGLRARYADLLQRIARRARTPEDRDRLTEQARRLNPDDWTDADAIRAQAPAVGGEWDALLAHLPARRRGRRGGRRRDGNPADGPEADEALSGGEAPSEIMAADGESNVAEDVLDAARSRGDGRDDVHAGGGGADQDSPGGRAGDGLQGDDEFRQD